MHIFEFYEETFPDHSLAQQNLISEGSSQLSSEKSLRNHYESQPSDKTVRFDLG